MRSNKEKRRSLWQLVYGSLVTKGYCLYCNKIITFESSSLEHLLPRSYGGCSKIMSGNLFLTCVRCNELQNKNFGVCLTKSRISVNFNNLINYIKFNDYILYDRIINFWKILLDKDRRFLNLRKFI